MGKVTLDDIANKVGVTKGLVSRALTGRYNVSDEMRGEITRAAVELGYDFDRLRAKSKKRGKCMLAMSSAMLSGEDYWQPIIRGLTSSLDSERTDVEYFIYDENDISATDIAKIKSSNVSGYVLMHNNPEKLVKAMETTGRPLVVIDPKKVCPGKHLQIKFSNFDSIYELTKMLIDCGHREICFYGARLWSVSFTERANGFSACMHDHAALGTKIHWAIFDNTAGYFSDNGMLEALLRQNPGITAIVCVNDIVAQNAVLSIKRLGKTVPGDYSVTGFDDIAASRTEIGDLTTVNVPRTALGEEAAKYLINHINNLQIKYSQIVISCEIVKRGSVAAVGREN